MPLGSQKPSAARPPWAGMLKNTCLQCGALSCRDTCRHTCRHSDGEMEQSVATRAQQCKDHAVCAEHEPQHRSYLVPAVLSVRLRDPITQDWRQISMWGRSCRSNGIDYVIQSMHATSHILSNVRFTQVLMPNSSFTSTLKSHPYQIPAFVPAPTLFTVKTTHMCRRDLTTNPKMEISRCRSTKVNSNFAKRSVTAAAGWYRRMQTRAKS